MEEEGGGGGEGDSGESSRMFRTIMVRFPFFAFADPVVHAIKTRPHDRRRRGVTRILSGRKRCVELLRSGVNRTPFMHGKTDRIRFPMTLATACIDHIDTHLSFIKTCAHSSSKEGDPRYNSLASWARW